MIDWKAYLKVIADAQRILLTTHENPDGDGLGCAIAMYHHFQEIGKDCRIINCTPLPLEYRFLDSDKVFEVFKPEKHRNWLSGVNLVMIFDIGDSKRLRTIFNEIQSYHIPSMNIDHHPQPKDRPFTYNLIDINAAATGEMIYDYLKMVRDGQLPSKICEGIYTAIMTDTGSFRYSNTNARCHEIAIECFRAGINHTLIYQQVYESGSRSKMKLLGKILSNLQYDHNDELAWFSIDKSMLEECGATNEDVDGISDFIRTIRGVEVALMIYEKKKDTCRVNLRSKGKYVINEIATSLGGGGHKLAAGALVQGSLESVLPKVLEVTRQSLIHQDGHIK